MNSSTLKQLLTQYERKKQFAELEAEKRKQELFESEPLLKQIDTNLKNLAISNTKLLITSNDPEILKNLQEQIANLKHQKELI